MVLDTLDHPSLVEYSVDVEEIVIDKNTSKYWYNQESLLQIKVLFRPTFQCNLVIQISCFSAGRALAVSGALVGAAGLLTNSRELQQVGGTALVGGVGLKTLGKLFGK